MSTAICDHSEVLRKMDLKVYTGLAGVMFELQANGFDNEFANSQVLRALNDATTSIGATSVDVRAYFCYTAKAEPALRLEVRNQQYMTSDRFSVVVVKPLNESMLSVVH